MNTSTKHFLPKVISAVIAVLLALTVAMPAMGAATEGENLTITIKNNKGLPAMTEDMFAVYQLFKGTPEKTGAAGSNSWEATNWNNYVLADIEWGISVKDGDTLLAGLKAVDEDWAKNTRGSNIFTTIATAADLAKVLVDKDNEFMQHFAKWLVKSGQLKALEVDDQITVKLISNREKPEEDSLIYEVTDAGYYLLAEQNELGEENTAESEYIIAVLGNQTINLKASIPTVNKVIKTTEGNVKGTSADINEELTFVIEGTLPKNYGDFTEGYEYIFHDFLPSSSYNAIKNVVVTISTDVDGNGTISADEIFTLTEEQYYIGTRSNSLSTIDCNQEFLIGKVIGSDGKIYSNIKSLEGQNVDGKTIKINSTSKITVQYTTSLNNGAKLGNSGTTGNKSSVVLQYSNDINANLTSASRTADSDVYVYTYGLDLKKVGNDAEHTSGLGGAGFLLYKTDSDGNISAYAKFDTITDSFTEEDIRYSFNNWVTAADVTPLISAYKTAKEAYDNASNDSAAELKTELDNAVKALQENGYLLTSADGTGEILDITGLAAGEYALTEVITPAGYNTMADYKFTITESINPASGLLTQFVYTPSVGTPKTFNSSSTYSAEFETGLIPDTLTNIKAPLLPFTGGIGTVIFYVLGGALIAGAIVYIVIIAKKRRKETENSEK